MSKCRHKLTSGTLLKIDKTKLSIKVCDICRIVRLEIKQEIELPVDTFVKDWNSTMRKLVK